MPITIDGTGTVTGISAGGLPDGSVALADLATGIAPRILLGTFTASASATLDLTGWYSSSYDLYEIDLIDVYGSVSSWSLLGRVSTNNGSTFDTGSNYNYSTLYSSGTAAGGSAASAAFLDFGGARGTNVSTDIGAGKITLYNPAGTRWKVVSHSSFYTGDTTNSVFTFFSSGVWRNTAAYNAFRLYPSSGTITGIARIYGIVK